VDSYPTVWHQSENIILFVGSACHLLLASVLLCLSFDSGDEAVCSEPQCAPTGLHYPTYKKLVLFMGAQLASLVFLMADSVTVNMEAVHSSGMSLDMYLTTQYYI
jgi:hypothetical protein